MSSINPKQHIVEQLQRLLAGDQIEDVLSALCLLPFPEIRDTGLLLSGELASLVSDHIKNTISSQDYRQERASIRSRTLHMVNMLDKAAGITDSEFPILRSLSEPSVSLSADQLEVIVSSSHALRNPIWYARGLEAAKSICRVVVPGHGNGTGFLIESRFLVTAHHVLPNGNLARKAHAKFNYEIDENGETNQGIAYHLKPAEFFITNCELDYTVVALGENVGEPITGPLRSLAVAADDPLRIGSPVSIVQHPYGGPKKIAVNVCGLCGYSQHLVHYLTDTDLGSSGAPVLNENWDVIAIHSVRRRLN